MTANARNLEVLAGEGNPLPSCFKISANGRPRFMAPRLARSLRGERRIARGGESLFMYHRGVYRAGGETWARGRIVEELADDWTRARADEVIAHLRDASPDLLARPPLDVINCRNGLLDLRTGKLGPHDPDLLSPVQLGTAYEPGAECRSFIRFLGQVLPDDTRAIVYELAGYLAVPDNSLQRAVMAVGSGANGKSTLTAALTAYLGEDNVATVPLHKLDEDRFAVASLYGRLANVFPDLDARALRSSSVFKAITGGDRLEAERKFRPAFTFTPYARLVFSANAVPPTSDSSEGFFRRWLVLPFEQRFDPAHRDPYLTAKLTTSAELSGLLNLAVPALADLRARGDFSASESTSRAADEFRISADSVSGFIDECCVIDASRQIPKPRIAAAYRDWCQTNGRGALGTARFNERLTALVPVQSIKVAGVRMWRGIATEDHR